MSMYRIANALERIAAALEAPTPLYRPGHPWTGGTVPLTRKPIPAEDWVRPDGAPVYPEQRAACVRNGHSWTDSNACLICGEEYPGGAQAWDCEEQGHVYSAEGFCHACGERESFVAFAARQHETGGF